MTQRYPNHLGREHGEKIADELPAAKRTISTDELSALLDQVRHHVALFVSEIPRAPRTVRVRAGEVFVEVEWAQEDVIAPSAPERAATTPVTASAEPVTEAESEAHYLTSPAVGVFYRALEPGAAPFVREGDTVSLGQQVGVIEAMKLMIPVEADKTGRIVEVVKDNGEPVEYGERLFVLAAADTA